MAEMATRWGEEDVAIECIRSRAVMLDEYLDRHKEALAVLDVADAAFGRNERLLRSRAVVLSTMGRHQEALDVLSTLVPSYSGDEPLERILMLRSAAISAGRVGEFAQSAQLFQQAFAAALNDAPSALGASVKPGLLADAAIMEIRDGRIGDALNSLIAALDIVVADQSGDPSLLFAFSAITHVTQWAAAGIDGYPFPADPSENPGTCSTLHPDVDNAAIEPRRPNQEWYLLARLETLSGLDAALQARLLQHERADGVQIALAVGLALTQVQRHVAAGDVERVIGALPRHVWLSALYLRSRGVPAAVSPEDMTAPAAWSVQEAQFARAAVTGLLGILIINGRLDDATRAADTATAMSPNLAMLMPGTGEPPTETADVFSSGLAALWLLRSDAWVSAENLLRRSVDIFTCLRSVGLKELDARVYKLIRSRWLHLAEHHRAILSIPRLSVPEIEAAAASTPGLAGIARLIEAGRLACSLGLSSELVEVLRITR